MSKNRFPAEGQLDQLKEDVQRCQNRLTMLSQKINAILKRKQCASSRQNQQTHFFGSPLPRMVDPWEPKIELKDILRK